MGYTGTNGADRTVAASEIAGTFEYAAPCGALAAFIGRIMVNKPIKLNFLLTSAILVENVVQAKPLQLEL